VRPQERIARRLRCVAVTEVEAHDAQCVNASVGGQAGDLDLRESSRPLGGQNRRRRYPRQCRWQVGGLREHHPYIGWPPLSGFSSIGESVARLGVRE